ncbi:unnamed protein product [Fusarium venenatum]|uniref:Uncharacterized protein n=2 Tax=Fusarium venenatum TaxID=56646 RepID=A0A2L2TFF0_9HYPO|nr:uncharacterized protein FVRRES_08895 [Fusarium venenatum]CEI68818.1 unnamed protein product [Fusarium venenatum]
MSTMVWRQTDFVVVRLHALEPQPQLTIATPVPEESKPPKTSVTLPRFWSANGENMDDLTHWEKPKGIEKIMGLVFYGRRQSVSILDCYLKRNLVKNGGLLDGVIFVERTKDPQDLALLQKLLESEDTYQKWQVEMSDEDNFSSGFGNSYDRVEDDVMYVKIDDDIVFVEDSVIPSIVKKKIDHPEYYIVSANVVNQPLLSWVHWNLGAIRPYLPEVDTSGKAVPFATSGPLKEEWSSLHLPLWNGPESFFIQEWDPEGIKHRWLPLDQGGEDHILDTTPIEATEYDPMGRGWTEWTIGAQEHFSFFENLGKNKLSAYKFDTWDFQYERMGIQFVALLGRDINRAKPIEADDENHFSCNMPRMLGRHAVADGQGVVAHYSFGSQRAGMDQTDVLDRYRSFASNHICAEPILWTPEEG